MFTLTLTLTLTGKRDNPMQLPLCSRSGDVIEPRLKPQWWVDCKDMAARAAQTVRDKELTLMPKFHESKPSLLTSAPCALLSVNLPPAPSPAQRGMTTSHHDGHMNETLTLSYQRVSTM